MVLPDPPRADHGGDAAHHDRSYGSHAVQHLYRRFRVLADPVPCWGKGWRIHLGESGPVSSRRVVWLETQSELPEGVHLTRSLIGV